MHKRAFFIGVIALAIFIVALVFYRGSTNGNSPAQLSPVLNEGDVSNGGLSNGSSGGTGQSSDFSNGTGSEANGQTSSVEQGGRGAFLSNGNSGDKNYCSNMDLSNCVSKSESVCGWFDPNKVSCTDGPCVKRYVGECSACADSRVVYWTEGECPFHG